MVYDAAAARWFIKGIPAPYDSLPILAVSGEPAPLTAGINRAFDYGRYYYYKPGDTQILAVLWGTGDSAFMTTGPGASAPAKQWILNPSLTLIGGSF